jgi:hypothetical protein
MAIKSISIEAKDPAEADKKAKAVSIMLKNLSVDSLVILANKSSKKGINDTIKMYQHLL